MLNKSFHPRMFEGSLRIMLRDCVLAQPKRLKSLSTNKVIAIRREYSSPWERRAPLSPAQVSQLVNQGFRILVQPSQKRAFGEKMYEEAGAAISEDMSAARLILGVKPLPQEVLIPSKTYAFFSHTIKGQPENMPLLDAILDKGIRLVDYEMIRDSEDHRLVAFGRWAGHAGMVDILHGLGMRLLSEGINTPFVSVGKSLSYWDFSAALAAVREAGYEISRGYGLHSLPPLTFVFTGSGNVSQGAQTVFRELPFKMINPSELPQVSRDGNHRQVYGTIVSRHHHLRNAEGRYNNEEYLQHPEHYNSNFASEIAPYASVIINGMYWASPAPRLIQISDAGSLLPRLLAIGDISADPGGSIEFMTSCTTIERPFLVYNPDSKSSTEGISGPGILIGSVDNLPAQFPREATEFFGSHLLPFIPAMYEASKAVPLGHLDLDPVLKKAVIASDGELTPDFKYIEDLRHQKPGLSSGKDRIVVFGSGLVAGPLVEHLCKHPGREVVIVSKDRGQGERLAARYLGANFYGPVDIQADQGAVKKLVGASQLAISMLPSRLHPLVAGACISQGVPFMTPSHLRSSLQGLGDAAQHAGVPILAELGLEPGLDHLLFLNCQDRIVAEGGKVMSLISHCGALPAPEYSENPLRYKFSWNPNAVLAKMVAMARYEREGKVVEIPEGGYVMSYVDKVEFLPGFNLESFPNQDSLIYKSVYGLQSAHTMMRCSLRFQGFTAVLQELNRIGLLSPRPHRALSQEGPDISWKNFLKVSLVGPQIVLLEELGLTDVKPLVKMSTPLDTLALHLYQRYGLQPGERDVVILRHQVGVTRADGSHEEHRMCLVDYGDPNDHSAIARTVGLPVAVAADLLLQGAFGHLSGAIRPCTPQIYRPLWAALRREGFTHTESVARA